MNDRWAIVGAHFSGRLPATTDELHQRIPQSLDILAAVCSECEDLADGGETLFGESLPKAKRGDGLGAQALIGTLRRRAAPRARLAEQFLAVLLLWLFPDFAQLVGCPADAFLDLERDLFGEQRRGKSGARSSVVRPALHPMELWAKYAAHPLRE